MTRRALHIAAERAAVVTQAVAGILLGAASGATAFGANVDLPGVAVAALGAAVLAELLVTAVSMGAAREVVSA